MITALRETDATDDHRVEVAERAGEAVAVIVDKAIARIDAFGIGCQRRDTRLPAEPRCH